MATRQENLDFIIDLETQMLKEMNTADPIPASQIPAFKKMRWMTYSVLSDKTIELYAKHLTEARSAGRNVLTEKYAMIGGQMPLPDRDSCGCASCCDTVCRNPEYVNSRLCNNETIDEIVSVEARWQALIAEKYPKAIRRQQGSAEEFARYMICELYTWGDEALKSYLDDVNAAASQGKNLAEARFDNLYASIGRGSLKEMEASL